MEVVDTEENIGEIENILSRGLPIEIYIRNLADQLDLIEMVRNAKLW